MTDVHDDDRSHVNGNRWQRLHGALERMPSIAVRITAIVVSFVPGLLIAACDRPAAGAARETRAAADSAQGDSAALASLPPPLAEAFAVRAVLTRAALRDTTAARCEPLLPRDTSAVRRRLRARLADGSRAVLFVRAARDTIRRVELVRRERGGGQRGLIWDASTDASESVEWRAGVARPDVTTLPRGGPVPRALRALGRQLRALPCARG